jgi:hypothetical protein
MEVFGALAILGFVVQVIVLGLLAAAFPLFWIWMLVDAVLREEHEYPAAGRTTRSSGCCSSHSCRWSRWFYFFMVYRKVKRSPAPRSPVHSAVSSPVEATTPAA